MHRNVTLIEMRESGLSLDRYHMLFGKEQRHRRPLRFVILRRYIEHLRAYHIGKIEKNIRKSLGVILLVDIRYVIMLFSGSLCVTHVVNIKTQRLSQVIESVQFQLLFHIDIPPHTASRRKKSNGSSRYLKRTIS